MNLIKYQRLSLQFSPKYWRAFSTQLNEEFTSEPEYPPILDNTYESKKKREVQTRSDAIKAVKTVEEKQIKLNMPKYYGWKSIIFDDKLIPYNSLELIQHCTRTHFKESALPNLYNTLNVDSLIHEIKSNIENALLFEHDIIRSHEIYKQDLDPCTKENVISDSIIKQINRIILGCLSSKFPHLLNAEIDHDPRHEAFWFVGGIYPPETIKKSREGLSWSKHLAEEPVNRAVQYLGKPSLAIRTELPLEPYVSKTEVENTELTVPFFNYDPKVLGFNTTHRHGTNIPGFWPGEQSEFGLLSFQRRGHMHNRSKTFKEKDDQDALHCHGLLSSFSWLLAQANYQGFTTYNDLTYPLVTQTVITNGQLWSFYVYQLNTVEFHSHLIHENPKRNFCWGTTTQKLYENIDKNGKIIGFNEDVLKNLLKFYVNVPKQRDGVDMKPYLDKNERIVAEIADPEKRDWLQKQYKHMMSNRPRHRQLYEIYHWEKIYKIDHKTRVMEPKRRPFELGINPWNRRYDERSPSYIPKILRPDGPKSKNKFYKMYYP